MKRYSILPKVVGDQESLDIIIENFGNPDIVIGYGLDCYEFGELKGLIIGGVVTAILSTIAILTIKRRNEVEVNTCTD